MERLNGLDIARYVAFIGMVIVNFKIVMGAGGAGDELLSLFTNALEGRAAATFVVLAGIGLGLSAAYQSHDRTMLVSLKRAGFLFVLGLLNMLIFDADILHYYAFYFAIGVFCLPFANRSLMALIVLVNLVFLGLLFTLDYETGWIWYDYVYVGFWTPAGFVRNLFFNGWHPVFPWVSFILFGILISRLSLADKKVQNRLIVFGLVVFVFVEVSSAITTHQFAQNDEDLKALLSTSPIPPMPWFIMVGMGVSSMVIGLCLRAADWFERIGISRYIIPAGRQTLTLYIAHIIIGMGTLYTFGLLGGRTLPFAVTTALMFCALATVFSYNWSKSHKRGPIEGLMRKLVG